MVYYNKLRTLILFRINVHVLTQSPKRQYRGIFTPTTPATTVPEWTPTRSLKCSISTEKDDRVNHWIFMSRNNAGITIGWILDSLRRINHVHGHVTDSFSMIRICIWSSTDHHIGVPNCFHLQFEQKTGYVLSGFLTIIRTYLVNSVSFRQLIEEGVHVIQHANYLHGSDSTADFCKSHHVGEQNWDHVKNLGRTKS